MHFLGIIGIIIQVYFAVHAGRTGRYWWIFIILFFPLLGSVIYFFVEYLPELQQESRIKKSVNRNSTKSIKQLKRELELTDSIQNRINLAEAFFREEQYQEAIELLEKCRAGIYLQDSHILEGLSLSYYYVGKIDEALVRLSELEDAENGKLPNNLKLLRAKIFETLGEDHRALEEYASIVTSYPGEEARCRYAVLLKKRGDLVQARELFEEILKMRGCIPSNIRSFKESG